MPLPAFLIPLLKVAGSAALSAMANKGNKGGSGEGVAMPRQEEPQIASIASPQQQSLQAQTQDNDSILQRLGAFQEAHPFLTAGAGGALGGLMAGGGGAVTGATLATMLGKVGKRRNNAIQDPNTMYAPIPRSASMQQNPAYGNMLARPMGGNIQNMQIPQFNEDMLYNRPQY
jgi:hypothetical protein